MSRLVAAAILLVAIACFLIEVSARDAGEGPLSDECLHAGTPTECAQAYNHR